MGHNAAIIKGGRLSVKNPGGHALAVTAPVLCSLPFVPPEMLDEAAQRCLILAISSGVHYGIIVTPGGP